MGTRCIIHSYVIMPNHIHLLIEPIGEWNIQNIVGAIKKYTAREINIMYRRHGRLWRKEYFDRIIRNEKHYIAVLDYIKYNPRNCNKGEFTYYTAVKW